jgi:hypothetical protein
VLAVTLEESPGQSLRPLLSLPSKKYYRDDFAMPDRGYLERFRQRRLAPVYKGPPGGGQAVAVIRQAMLPPSVHKVPYTFIMLSIRTYHPAASLAIIMQSRNCQILTLTHQPTGPQH